MHYRTDSSLSASASPRMLMLSILMLIICGCREDKVRRHKADQIHAVNAAIDKWNRWTMSRYSASLNYWGQCH